jgi:hypothetical protein
MRHRRTRALRLGLGIVLAAASPVPTAAEEERSSCVLCHGQLEDEMLAPVAAWSDDVHAAAGLGCVGCHGGDPSPALADDVEAMAASRGFHAAPDRLVVAEFCGTCHADPAYMRRFDPQARVDQLSEYWQSGHGRRNAQGDPVPATCTDCHGAHGIRPVSRPDSPVHATRVPETCARCHASPETMAPYGLPADPFDLYRRSVHGVALLERGDTAAPACNDCHGNHGAAPPGVTSVANVCGQCHGREAALFRDSPKHALFDGMDVPECSGCHGNHLVRHPTPAMVYGETAPRASQGRIASSDPLLVEVGALAAGASAEVQWTAVLLPHAAADDAGFDHRVRIDAGAAGALELDATVVPGLETSAAGPRRAASDALAATLAIESVSGEPIRAGDALSFRLELVAATPVEARVVDRPGRWIQPHEGSVCLTCHTPGDDCDVATGKMFEAITSLDRNLREAERMLRRAEHAGMEVADALFHLKSEGTTAAIESRALVHAFVPERLMERTAEGQAVATAGRAAAEAAFAELQFRRRGLAVSLVLVALVLLGLYLKIREVEARRAAS